jgi:hypothetical protein
MCSHLKYLFGKLKENEEELNFDGTRHKPIYMDDTSAGENIQLTQR